MKREAKILSLFLLGLLVVSILSNIAPVVSAADPQDGDTRYDQGYKQIYDETIGDWVDTSDQGSTGTGSAAGKSLNTAKDFIGGFWSGLGFNGFSKDTKLTIANILLGLLLLVVIYAVSSVLPFFPDKKDEGKIYRFLFALIISILAFMFVTPKMVEAIVTNYTALGVMLVSIVPLVILISITVALREKGSQYGIVNKILILGFIVFLVFAWSTGLGTNWDSKKSVVDNLKSQEGKQLQIIYLITLVAALIWLFIEGMVSDVYSRYKRKMGMKEAAEVWNAGLLGKIAKKEEEINALAGKTDEANVKAREKAEEELEELKKYYAKKK